MSVSGIRRGRSGSACVKIGKPAALSARASDSPFSRPPSIRCTTTRIRCAAGTRPACGSGSVPSGPPGSTLSSLMGWSGAYLAPPSWGGTDKKSNRSFVAMLAPGLPPSTPIRNRFVSAQLGLGRTPPVDDPFGAWDPLRDALHLGCARGQGGRAAEVARLRHHDADGQRNQRGAVRVAGAILRFDPPALAVGQVVQRRHLLVE